MEPTIRSFDGNEQSFSIRVLRCCNVCFARVFHRVEVRTPCRLPRHGPGILVSNHLSGVDPVMIQAACPRLIRWMMAKEYYELPGARSICAAVGAIPVNRTAKDLTATRLALAALDAGYILGVFPEGKIAKTSAILPFQAGIALLAAKSGATIYPAHIEGTQRGKSMWQAYLGSNTTSLRFGEPLRVSQEEADKLGYERMAERIREKVEILRKQEVEYRKNQSTILSTAAYSW